MTTYTQTFGGTNIYPSDVSYRAVALTANTTLDWPLETAPTQNVVADIMDVTPSAGGYTIRMPSATEASTGATVLFNNTGAFTFTVADNGGNTICTLTSGQTFQIYLTSNTTVNGSWRAFQYGASASASDAAALAGLGLKAISTTLNTAIPTSTFNTNYTAGVNDRAKAYIWNGGSGTLTLDPAVTLTNDWFIYVRNAGTGDLTIDPNAGETINGGATLTMSPEDSAIIVCNATQFWTIGLGQDVVFAFTLISIDVAGSGNYTLSTNELNKIAYRFTGVLTGNRDVIVPNTVQQYWADNQTSGSYTLGLRTSGQASPGVTVTQGGRSILYCDGNEVVDADTSTIALPVPVSQGGTGSVTAGGALINLGGTSTGIGVFTAVNTTAAQIAIGLDPIQGGTY